MSKDSELLTFEPRCCEVEAVGINRLLKNSFHIYFHYDSKWKDIFSVLDDLLQNTNIFIIDFENANPAISWIAVLSLISDWVLSLTFCVSLGLYREVWVYGFVNENAIIIFQSSCSVLKLAFNVIP